MSDKINENINVSNIAPIVSSQTFLSLQPDIQNKIIDTVHEDTFKEGGLIGKLIGFNTSNASLNAAYTVILLLFAFLIIETFHAYWICSKVDIDLVKLVVPAISLALGYIFGRGH